MKRSIAGIIRRQGKFLVGLRLPTGEMGSRWEFPGGKVDPGEDPHQSIIREFREEMGVTVSIGEKIATVHFTNRGGEVELSAYEVFMEEDSPRFLTEHVSVDWVSLDEIPGRPFVDSDALLLPFVREWYARHA